jgi:class 3 adenylate cyclase
LSATNTGLTVDDLVTLVGIGRDLAAEVDLKPLLQRILDTASSLTDSPDSSVILFDESRKRLYIAHATGNDAAMLMEKWGKGSEKGIPLVGSKAGEVFTSGKAVVVDAVQSDPRHFKGVDRDTGRVTQSMVCVPLTVGEKSMGVVQILNKRSGNYSPRDQVILEYFAAQAAVAIRNARLFDDLLAHMGLYTNRSEHVGPMELLAELRRPAYSEEVSILFADMRGFTQLCHVVNRPERLQDLLNEFLAMLAEAVISHDGVVNKFLGDGLMAFFRGGNNASRAVACGGAIIRQFDEMGPRWNKKVGARLSFVDIGVGIATDLVMLGSWGASQVKDFTAVGSAVNLAALLMEQARNGRRFLVDKLTFLGASDQILESEGPEAFEFAKPGQTVVFPYDRYLVKKLTSSAPSASTSPAAAPDPFRSALPRANVFISYSHKDRAWLDRLSTHLKPYVRGGSVTVWDDTKIKPGSRWLDEIKQALSSTRVAILLVSPNFLESDFIARGELPPILAAAQDAGMKILWIPLSASSYDETEISAFQAAMDPMRPLDVMLEAEQNKVWVSLCKIIKATLTTPTR